jgi:hypothetical protein
MNQIDTTNRFVGVQVWRAEIFEVGTPNSWLFILDGKTETKGISEVPKSIVEIKH